MTAPNLKSLGRTNQKSPAAPMRAIRRKRRNADDSAPLHSLMRLQQTIGNRGVGRMIQAKMQVSQPGDQLEKEADQTADRVMRMPEPQIEENEELRRQPAEEKDENEKLQKKAEQPEPDEELQRVAAPDDDEKKLQTKSEGSQAPTVSPRVQSHIDSLRGNGRPLPESLRASLEPRFGHDFSGVRIHTDTHATEAAQAVHAKAFTIGRDVVFGRGEYAPESTAGKKLLAHELAHVVQQTSQQNSPSLQRYPVPGELQCREVVAWLDQHSPYIPEWAQTRVDYSFEPQNFGNVSFTTTSQGVEARVRGNPRTRVIKSAPRDMPTWNPTRRPNRNAEVNAWLNMRGNLQSHENEHARLGEQWRQTLQSRARQVSFTVVGSNEADARNNAINELDSRAQQWISEAQAASDDFDARTDHGRRADAGFPAVNLNCP